MVNVCFNGNGDLSSALNLTSGSSAPLTSFVTAASQIQYYKSNSANLTASTATTFIKNSTLTPMSNDIRLTYLTANADNPTTVLTEFQKYTDSGFSGNYQTSCTTKTKDDFVQAQGFCPTGYPYLVGTSASANLAGPNCLVVSEWANVCLSYYFNFINNLELCK